MKQLNESKILSTVLYAGCFLLLFLCNFLTLFILDDYAYMFSFADGERMTHIGQIIPSMIAHANSMNGRIAAHTLVQLFAITPKWFFDLVNALMFTFQIALILRISEGSNRRNNLLLLAVMCAVWLYEPCFSHVNLWQDGSVNYLWSIVFGLLFLRPFIDEFLFNKHPSSPVQTVIFWGLSFITGAYSETVSIAVLFMAFLLEMLRMLLYKYKLHPHMLIAIVLAFAGYVSIYLAPAQWMNKAVEPSLKQLLINFVNAVLMYRSFGILVISYVILTILSIACKRSKEKIILSAVFFAGSLTANFIMVLALYYSGRSAVGAFILLLCANTILITELLQDERYRELSVCVLAALIVATIPSVFSGILDIASTYTDMRSNEIAIIESRDQGIMDVAVPIISSETKYGVAFDALELDTENRDAWMNQIMAKYYGVDSILGEAPADVE